MTTIPHANPSQPSSVPGFSRACRTRRDRLQLIGARARQLDAYAELWSSLDRPGVHVTTDPEHWDRGWIVVGLLQDEPDSVRLHWRMGADAISVARDGGEVAHIPLDDDGAAVAWLGELISSIRYD